MTTQVPDLYVKLAKSTFRNVGDSYLNRTQKGDLYSLSINVSSPFFMLRADLI